MKKFLCIVITAVMLLSLIACGNGDTQPTQAKPADPVLQAGFGMESITPAYSVPLQGNDYNSRWSEGVRDNVYATCIALRSGDDTVLLYTIDIKLMSGVKYDSIKEAINEETGVPVSNIFMNATHTHSAPAIRYSWNGSIQYAQEFADALVDAASQAIEDLAPATAYAGYTQTEGLAYVRHYLMNDGSVAGPNFGSLESGRKEHVREADGQMGIVQFKRDAGKKDIILVNFGVHPTFVGTQDDKLISADFPGPTRDYIAKETGAHVAYFTAAAGDQTGMSNLNGVGKVVIRSYYDMYGRYLGQYAVDALETLKPIEGTAIKLVSHEMSYATNKENLDKTREQMNGPFEADWISIRRSLPNQRNMTIKALSVGNLGFISAPYEMFGEQGKYIKDNSPFETTVVLTCGEGNNSYLSSIAGFEYNCYESQVCFYARGVAEQIAKDFVTMLEELRDR